MEESLEEKVQMDDAVSTELCLNCGTKLKGEYCHNCGQHITDHRMTVKRFLLDYLDNAFLWDSQQLKTMWRLISRPGLLTKEYVAGKFASQVQPLKLNMFLLFVFLTLFLFFGSDRRINNSIHDITSSEEVIAGMQVEGLIDNPEYVARMNASSRDTINIAAPLYLAENYPDIFEVHQVTCDSEGETQDRWTAVVPHVIIEDNIIRLGEDGYYRFDIGESEAARNLALFQMVWDQMSAIAIKYFPIIILLTAPFLAIALRIVQRKKSTRFFTHFIFSMHYIAFVELTCIVLYLMYLIAHPGFSLLNILFAICSCVYFAIAFRVVYETTWFRSITKALLSNVIYYAICLSIFVVLIFVAIVAVSNKMV